MYNTKNNQKSISVAIGVAVGFLVVFLVKQFIFAQPSFDKAMMQAASKINESCPVMVDKDTRLDNAIALPDNIFQYNYTLVNLVKDSIDIPAFQNYIRPIILNNIKTNPDLKAYRNHKVTMRYNYKDTNGNFVVNISIAPNQYLVKN